MALIRDWTKVSDTGKTVAQLVADSTLYFPVDNAEVGASNQESIALNESEFVTLLSEIGVSSADASTTVKGIVEEADSTEINNGTDTGATGARLFVTPSQLRAYANERLYEFSSNLVTALEKSFYGVVEILALNINPSAATISLLETRLGTGTRTTRADLTAVNAYLAGLTATDHPHLRISTTPITTGKYDIKVPFIKVQ